MSNLELLMDEYCSGIKGGEHAEDLLSRLLEEKSLQTIPTQNSDVDIMIRNVEKIIDMYQKKRELQLQMENPENWMDYMQEWDYQQLKQIEVQIRDIENRGEDTDWNENMHELSELYAERLEILKQIAVENESDKEKQITKEEIVEKEGYWFDEKSGQWVGSISFLIEKYPRQEQDPPNN